MTTEQQGKKDKIEQLGIRKKEILDYGIDEGKKIQKEIDRNKEIIRSCEGCFDKLKEKTGFEEDLKRAKKEEQDARDKIQKIKDQITSLKEQKNLAEKLQLKDKECPVCGSEVEELKAQFQIDEAEFEKKRKELKESIESKEKERGSKEAEVIEFTNELDKVRDSETILNTHSIKTGEQLLAIQNDIEVKEKKWSLANSKNLEEMSQIDERAKLIFEKISTLESETEGFDEAEFEKKRKELKESIESKEKERGSKEAEVIEFTNELDKVRDSETILNTHSIKTGEQLLAIQNDIEVKEKKWSLANSKNLEEMSQIDERAKLIFEKISTLESETEGLTKQNLKISKIK